MASAPILAAAARLSRSKAASSAAPPLAVFVTRRCLSAAPAIAEAFIPVPPAPAPAQASSAHRAPRRTQITHASVPAQAQAPAQAPRRKQIPPAAKNILLNLNSLKRRQTTRFGPPKPASLAGVRNTVALGRAFGARPPGAAVRRGPNGTNGLNGHGRGANGASSLVQGGSARPAAPASLLQGRPSPGMAQGRPQRAASLVQGGPSRPPPKPQLGLVQQGRGQVNGHHHQVNGSQVHGHRVNSSSAKPLNGANVNGYSLNGANGSAYTTSLEEKDADAGTPEPRTYDSDLVVVLDMDECLIHSQFLSHQQSSAQLTAPDDKYRQDETGRPSGSPAFNADEEAESIISSNCEYFRIHLPDGDLVHVNKRPQLDDFLKDVCSRFETHVFTAAVGMYADPLLDRLDLDNDMFHKRLYRESCTLDSDLGAYVKDLHAILGGREPWGGGQQGSAVNGASAGLDQEKREELFAKYNEGRVVLVDNNPLSFLAQPSNGILVSNFYDDPKDATLEAVSELLDELDSADDVRPVLDERFGLGEALGDVLKYSGGGWR